MISGNPAFARFMAARAASALGNWVTITTLVLYVEASDAPAIVLGVLLIARALPQALGPLAGAIVDRVDQRRLMVFCDVGQVAVVGALAVFLPPLPVTIALVAASGLLWTLFLPAGRSVVPSLVSEGELARANAFLASSTNVGFAIGPALGGLLVAVAGFRGALLFDVLTFIVSVALLLRLPSLPPENIGVGRQDLASGFREGLCYVLASRLARALAVGMFLYVAFAAMDNVALVYLVRDSFGSGEFGYGLALSAWATGMISAPLILTQAFPRLPSRFLLFSGFGLTGLGLVCIGLSPGIAFAFVVLAIGGAGNGLESVGVDTMIQESFPRPMLGRIFGTIYAPIFLAESLAALAGGLLVELLSARTTFLIAGLGVLATLLLLRRLLPNPPADKEPGLHEV